MAAIEAGAAMLLLLALAARRGDLLAMLGDSGQPVDLGDDGAEQGQGGAALELAALLGSLDVSPYMQPDPMPAADANLRAFLQTIRQAEGTAGPDGYRTMFGGDLINSYADHPRRAVMPRRAACRSAQEAQFQVPQLPLAGCQSACRH